MDTMLVRLKPFDPRRGFVLQRYTFRGIKFHQERGWYRVPKDVADYLRAVNEIPGDALSPLAFDVASDAEAAAIDAREESENRVRRSATDNLQLSLPRNDPPMAKASEPAEGGLTPRPEEPKGRAPEDPKGKRDRS